MKTKRFTSFARISIACFVAIHIFRICNLNAQGHIQNCDTAASNTITMSGYDPECFQPTDSISMDSGAVVHADAADLQSHFWLWGCFYFGNNPAGQSSLAMGLGLGQTPGSLAASLRNPSGKMIVVQFDTRTQPDSVFLWTWDGTTRHLLDGTTARPNGADLADGQFHYIELGWSPPDPNNPNNNYALRLKLYFENSLRINIRYNIIDSLFQGQSNPNWWIAGQNDQPFGNQQVTCIFENNCSNSTLSVTFTSVEAFVYPKKEVLVRWRVGREIALAKYYVERSFDGIEFMPIAIKTPTNNSQYNFIDMNRTPGPRHYRIAAEDIDGTIHYSTIVHTYWEDDDIPQISINPNPIVTGMFVIQADTNGQYRLLTVQGSELTQGTFSKGNTSVFVEGLAAGCYWVELKTQKAKINKRIIIAPR